MSRKLGGKFIYKIEFEPILVSIFHKREPLKCSSILGAPAPNQICLKSKGKAECRASSLQGSTSRHCIAEGRVFYPLAHMHGLRPSEDAVFTICICNYFSNVGRMVVMSKL